MFTGIIEELGIIRSTKRIGNGLKVVIEGKSLLEDLKIRDSVSINGCCLTCVDLCSSSFSVDVVEETLRKTCLGDLKVGDYVNLERPMLMGGRVDGHLVQGHVDQVGTIFCKKKLADDSYEMTFQAPAATMRYIVEKGSVAVDGVSLTAWNVNNDFFSVALIPYTAKNTTLGIKGVGDRINLEIDLVAKYIEKLTYSGRKL
ncbi:Riboflavin synthase [Chlamydiales bacterium STE3]|nr:Riboflavin synthase [Chlamydiales bacterium STE3]